MIPILLIVNFARIFYKQNFKQYIIVLGIIVLIFIYFLIQSIKFTNYKDSLFFLLPIASTIMLKFGFMWFHAKYHENLINTFKFFQFERPIYNKLIIHRIYNIIFISLFCIIPLVCFMLLLPSTSFNKYFYKLINELLAW